MSRLTLILITESKVVQDRVTVPSVVFRTAEWSISDGKGSQGKPANGGLKDRIVKAAPQWEPGMSDIRLRN